MGKWNVQLLACICPETSYLLAPRDLESGKAVKGPGGSREQGQAGC